MAVLTVVAKIQAKAGSEEVVKQALIRLIAPTRSEDGCISYHMHLDTEHPGVFMFYEDWESELLLEKHLASSHIKGCFDEIDELLEPVEVHKLVRLP